MWHRSHRLTDRVSLCAAIVLGCALAAGCDTATDPVPFYKNIQYAFDYVLCDENGNRVYALKANADGTLTTVGTVGAPDGGTTPNISVELSYPSGADVVGNYMFIADQGHHRIVRVDLSTGAVVEKTDIPWPHDVTYDHATGKLVVLQQASPEKQGPNALLITNTDIEKTQSIVLRLRDSRLSNSDAVDPIRLAKIRNTYYLSCRIGNNRGAVYTFLPDILTSRSSDGEIVANRDMQSYYYEEDYDRYPANDKLAVVALPNTDDAGNVLLWHFSESGGSTLYLTAHDRPATSLPENRVRCSGASDQSPTSYALQQDGTTNSWWLVNGGRLYDGFVAHATRNTSAFSQDEERAHTPGGVFLRHVPGSAMRVPPGISVTYQDNIVTATQGGRLLWQYNVNTSASGVFWPDANFTVHKLVCADLDGDGQREVVVSTHHKIWYPARVVICSESSGAELGTYWNAGWINDLILLDVNGDGKSEVICAGGNNDADCASVFALPATGLHGQSPPYLGTAERGNHLWYTMLPVSGANGTNFVQQIVFDQGVIKASNSTVPFAYRLDRAGTILP